MLAFSAPDIIYRSPGCRAFVWAGVYRFRGVIEGAEDTGQFQPAPLDAEAVLSSNWTASFEGWI